MIILSEGKPKYTKLDELIGNLLGDIRYASTVNVIVDVKEFVRKFFRPNITTDNNSSYAIEEISSDLINVIGHYRNYFFKNGKHSRFYFLYSESECTNITKYHPEYKYDHYQKYFHDEDNSEKINIIKKAILVVKKVLSVIPNAIYVDTSEYDELVYAKSIVKDTPNNELIFLLSNDTVMYQILNNHTFAISLKGIKSELITDKTAINYICKKDDYDLSVNMLPLLFSLSGVPKYNIGNVRGFALVRAAKLISAMIEKGNLTDAESIDCPIDFSILDEDDKLDCMFLSAQEGITETYDLITQNERLYSSKQLIQEKLKMKKYNTPTNIFLELNAKIFLRCPLNITMLVKGE